MIKPSDKQFAKLRFQIGFDIALRALVEGDMRARDRQREVVLELNRLKHDRLTRASWEGPPGLDYRKEREALLARKTELEFRASLGQPVSNEIAIVNQTIEGVTEQADLEDQIASAQTAAAELQESANRWATYSGVFHEVLEGVLKVAQVDASLIGSSVVPPPRMLAVDSKEREKLDRVREKLDDVDAELDVARDAILPIDECVANFMHDIGAQREVARTRLSYCMYPGSRPDIGTLTLGFLDLLLPGEIEKRARDYFAGFEVKRGLPRSQRPAVISKLEQKRVTLLQQEELETCRLEALGYVVVRRRDVDPALILHVWDGMYDASAIPSAALS